MKRVVASCAAVSLLLAGAHARADGFAPGSLIIPMDTTYQNSGMFRAYGLVYALLRQGVPVRWIIKPGKAFQAVDFVATAKDHQTNAVIASYGYRGGPWIIDAADKAAALPIIDAWQAANPATKVHEATASFTADVAKYLVVAPNIAMFADGNQDIARGYLVAAGIPDSTLDPTWPNNSPDMLDPLEVAGPTAQSHADGKLFDADGDPVYCQLMSMHWNVSSAVANPEVVAEVRQYLTHPTHFFAECQAVNAYENLVPYGHFLTPNGYVIKPQPNAVDFHHFDSPFAQIDGNFATVGGSEPAYALPVGDSYKAGGITMITAAGAPEGTHDLWMTGFIDGVCPPNVEVCGTLGKVSYLGGHKYETNLPISSNPKSQGTRLFLNSLFDSTCATQGGFPQLSLFKSAPLTTQVPILTYTLTYVNLGPSVALAAVLEDAIPPSSTFVSATNGGTFANGVVTWSLGNLGANEAGSVSFTVDLLVPGITYENTASLDYKVGLNPFSMASNTTTTLYDQDTDGDGIYDGQDICPDDYNPAQDLSSDIQSCGACGVVCVVQNGAPGCNLGVCVVAACDPGYSDCDGLYADGCEYPETGFANDEANCGGCGVLCAPAHATGDCQGGSCGLGVCSPGYANCNGLVADGCEYATAGFASDPANCGGCGLACAPGFVCQAGGCVIDSCPPGFSDCNGLAADGCEYANAGFATDEGNCGGCGLVCDPPFASGLCNGGACGVGACDPGHSDCNGLPGDGCEYQNAGFMNDTSNCGGCGVVCAPANGSGACSGGVCGIGSCNPGFANCNGLVADGCEYDAAGFLTDEANCGGCGVICDPPGATGDCLGGACGIASCDPGHVDLDANPANGCEYACTASSAVDATCDGIDDDCDGLFDEDYAPVTCGQGACVASSVCIGGAASCTPGSPTLEGPPGAATCSDGIDNDCNGSTDVLDVSCQGCAVDADCDDGNPCTADTCVGSLCQNAGIANCGGGGAGGAGGAGGGAGAGAGGAGAGGEGAGGVGGATGSGGGGGAGATGAGGAGAGGGGAGGEGATTGAGGATSGGSSTGSSTGSTSTSGGGGGATGAGDSTSSGLSGDPGDEGGCGCRTIGARPSGRSSWILVVSPLALWAARRRRSSRRRGVAR